MRLFTLVSVGVLAVTVGTGLCATDRVQGHSQDRTPAIESPEEASLAPITEEPLAAGEIVAVDRQDGRLTVAHRGIGRFYLEPGTRIFRVEDPVALTGLTPGDKIRFDVERDGKAFVITRLENSN
jgi:Cu/Ag efflux protein CusF